VFPGGRGGLAHSAFPINNKISERKRGPFFLFLPDEPVAPKSPSSLSRAGHGERALMSSDCRVFSKGSKKIADGVYIEKAVWVFIIIVKGSDVRMWQVGTGFRAVMGNEARDRLRFL
jgi:hypothetical protein